MITPSPQFLFCQVGVFQQFDVVISRSHQLMNCFPSQQTGQPTEGFSVLEDRIHA